MKNIEGQLVDDDRGATLAGISTLAIDTTAAGDVFHGAFAYGVLKQFSLEETLQLAATKAESLKTATELAAATSVRPEARPSDIVLASVDTSATLSSDPEVVTRVSTSGGRHWGINVGRYNTRYEAERVLLKTALAEMSTLDNSLRKVVKRPQGFDANFLGMTKESADLACRRLQARNVSCFMVGPG